MTKFELEEDGYSEIAIPATGSKPEQRATVDVFTTFNEMGAIWDAERKRAKESDSPLTRHLDAWVKYLDGIGLKVSAALASRIYGTLSVEVDRLEKKDPSNKPAEIPKPTASPSGPTPAPDTLPAL